MKKLLLILVALAVIVLVAALVYAFLPTTTPAVAGGEPTASDTALIAQGKYLAAAGDCTACHTAPGGKPFAGGLPIASPIGTIYSTNITPDADTGIGTYTLNDFDRAVRHGITPAGGTLYPAMPYPSYIRMTDADTRALYAYFKFGVPAIKAENRSADIAWPLSMRWPLAIWRKTFAPDPQQTGFEAGAYSDPELARGAYLVQGLGHCGTCHTPRAQTLQEVALSEHDGQADAYLAGGQVIDGWVAVNLRGNTADGLGSWSQQDIVDTLKTARNPHTAVVGNAMADVVEHSTQHLSDEDLNAMAAYLKTLPAAPGDVASFNADPATATALQAGINDSRGAELYVDNCAACHRTDAQGYAHAFPKIAGNPSVLAKDPATLVRLILAGSSLPSTQAAPSNLGMPGFAERLSDDEVAQLGTYIRSSWGNQASAVTVAQVKAVRASLAEEGTAKHGAPHDPTQADAGDK
ncbi:Cytochrome c, mono-and diheme variants [Pseudoxanthomonas sp. GM95]|uniref:cytochrome c n=1 Tax=Pseudoxanthomonas sp. GM95 TaxID=1881043 RepID=UPI0008D2246D|nr:cytochrome c [Pseudoxanthomonas sp. GM95]SEM22532.1 Cytochrome c, mono-and diheme variants [Pseudoxanthomonas sp. GM95]